MRIGIKNLAGALVILISTASLQGVNLCNQTTGIDPNQPKTSEPTNKTTCEISADGDIKALKLGGKMSIDCVYGQSTEVDPPGVLRCQDAGPTCNTNNNCGLGGQVQIKVFQNYSCLASIAMDIADAAKGNVPKNLCRRDEDKDAEKNIQPIPSAKLVPCKK